MFDTFNLHIEFTCSGEAAVIVTAMRDAYALCAGEPDAPPEMVARCSEVIGILDARLEELRLAMHEEDARDEGRLQMVGTA